MLSKMIMPAFITLFFVFSFTSILGSVEYLNAANQSEQTVSPGDKKYDKDQQRMERNARKKKRHSRVRLVTFNHRLTDGKWT